MKYWEKRTWNHIGEQFCHISQKLAPYLGRNDGCSRQRKHNMPVNLNISSICSRFKKYVVPDSCTHVQQLAVVITVSILCWSRIQSKIPDSIPWRRCVKKARHYETLRCGFWMAHHQMNLYHTKTICKSSIQKLVNWWMKTKAFGELGNYWWLIYMLIFNIRNE